MLIFVVADVVLLARKFESRSLSFLLFLAVERGIVLRSENQQCTAGSTSNVADADHECAYASYGHSLGAFSPAMRETTHRVNGRLCRLSGRKMLRELCQATVVGQALQR